MTDLSPKQSDGIPFVVVRPRFGKETIYATHNFCDPTTWYSESERVVSKALTQTGSVWASGDPNWIDMLHGKILDEDALSEEQQEVTPSDPHGYSVIVTVDGVEQTARTPFAPSGGDYTINYVIGEVTAAADWTGKDVRASYSKATTSGWILTPSEGRSLVIDLAEIQFSSDIVFSDTFEMTVYGNADFFAPQLGLPAGTSIPIENTKYKTLDQIIDEAVEAYPVIPPIAGPRGFTSARQIFQFHYGAARTVWSSLGMTIRISIDGNQPFGGERATATFYCLSKSDDGPENALKILTGD
jgi:hypothetical protein